ncbi:MAG TPA: LamG-like jellyroll fold domain-containing protein, partial [Bacteroidales bacterium]|nr:LamG-like jellyroll fold domain-containing protein [Bacteroidales bacterium]
FSNGLMWGHGYAGQDDIGGIYFYTYHQDMAGGYGDCIRWGNFKFQPDPERWYNVTIRMVMNTVRSDGSGGNKDGLMEGFVDGKLVVSKTGMRFRNLSGIHIDKMKIYSHYGGSGTEYGPSNNEWTEIDDVCLFTYADGVNVPRGNNPSPSGRILQLPNLSSSSSATSGTTPAAPGSLVVTGTDASSVSIKWSDNATNEDGYRLERSTSATSGFNLAANLSPNITSFTDAGLSSNTKYYYRIRSYNSYGNSSWAGPVPVTTGTASSSPSPSTGSGDMLACWLLDNTGNDESGNNHNLSLYNGAGFAVDHKQGTHSLVLDGTDDYATCQPIDLGSRFTVGMWVKIPSGRPNIQTILANGTSGSTSNGFKLMVNTYGTSDAKIAFETGDGTISAVTRSNGSIFEFGTWNYVTVTVDKISGVVKLYYNGSDVTSQAGSHKSFKSNDILKLGTMTNDIFDMAGEIDHLDILGRVLSGSEIQDLMLAKEPVKVVAPSLLKATSLNGEVSLSWNDNSDNETGFIVERSPDDTSTFSVVKTLGANQLSFADNQVSINRTYFYRVKAIADLVESDYSTTTSINVIPPLPAAPSNLKTGNASLNSMQLTWIDNATYEEGFYVERSTDPTTGFSQIAKVGPNIMTFNDQSLAESTTYYYRVRAWNSAGNSNWSTVASGTTASPAPPPSQPGMIAYWPVEYSGKDLSGNSNDLTLHNGVLYSSDKKIGTASITLDGTDDYASSPALDPGNTFTITTWVKIPSGESNIQTIIANGASGSNSDG